jgi:hypothetical protein
MTTLNLRNIIDVTVTVSPAAAARGTFNEMLILGITGLSISETITTVERVREYASLAEMLADGFAITDAEYLAASVYFAQSPSPIKVWIGVRDNTSSPEESIAEALEASWYIAYSVEAVASDIEEMALAVQSMTPSTVLVWNSSDTTILEAEPVVDDLATVLKDNSYSRTIGVFSTDDHIAAGIMGVACGLNTGLANSSFTLLGKSIIGNVTEEVTSSQRGIVEAKNCNLYVSYANYYNVFEQGVMANGYFFDQVLQRDMLVNDIQLSCMDLIYQNKKVPQTEAGMLMIYNALMSACESAVTRGHLGAGTYTGASFMNLNYGDAMPNGYVIQSEKLSDQTAADRALRKSVSFYITVKEAGAVHSMNIECIINV